MIFIRSRRSRSVAVVIGVVPVFLAGLAMGVGGPARSLLPAFAQPSLLDYSNAPFRSFPSLRAPFVDQALGDRASPPARLDRSVPASGVLERLVVEHSLTNDDFADAKRIPRVPYTAKTNTTGATREDEPADCSSTGGTVWYRYRASRDEALIADTIGTGYPPPLGVFQGSALTRLRFVACATGITTRPCSPHRTCRLRCARFQELGRSCRPSSTPNSRFPARSSTSATFIWNR